MSLTKITNSDISTYGVVAASDKLTGTAQQNKSIFDRLVSTPVKNKFNALIDALVASTGAAEIGSRTTGLDATTVQGSLTELVGDIAGKVDKISGKGLSTNDYDATEKQKVAACNTAKHTHSNKTVLDGIESTDISNWDTVTGKENASNKVTTLSSASTNTQYPSAKAVYDAMVGSGTSAVHSVNGKVGTVVLAKSDIGLTNVDNTSDTNKPVSTAQQTAINLLKPKKISISLPTASWTGSASPYYQTITVTGSTANSKIDLQPGSTVFAQLLNDNCYALYINNDNNTIRAYAVGNKPTINLTIQATMCEVR